MQIKVGQFFWNLIIKAEKERKEVCGEPYGRIL